VTEINIWLQGSKKAVQIGESSGSIGLKKDLNAGKKLLLRKEFCLYDNAHNLSIFFFYIFA
jgi:hypothetical protein